MGRREEETRKAIKEAKKETFVGTKERILHEIAISLAVIADMMTDKAESEDEIMWKSILAVWGSTAMAIGIALYYTHDMRCLWFLLIPACMSYRSNDEADSEDCRDCKKFDDCPCGKDGHESGTSQGYSIGECKDFEPQESEEV